MAIINEISEIENRLISEYVALPVWDEIANLGKQELSSLLIKNYSYSKHFPAIIETALNGAKFPDSRTAIDHIVQEENEPREHITMHKALLDACGLSIRETSGIEKEAAIDELVIRSMEYVDVNDEKSELAMLCFLRLGSEILAGELYRALRKVVPKEFDLSDGDIEFISLHAEHDRKSTDLGIKPDESIKDSRDRTPHADHFNLAIKNLVRKIGPTALAPARAACEEAFRLRKAYVEHLVDSSIRT